MVLNRLPIGQKLALGFIFVLIISTCFVVFSIYQLMRISHGITKDVPQSIANVKHMSHLDGLAQFIRYYDEVLTQSARNYAFTGDTKWKDRYNSNVAELDVIIKEAIEKGDSRDGAFFDDVNVANLALVDMETKALELVDVNRGKEAVAILESDEYHAQKNIYEQGLRAYVAKRGEQYNQTIDASTDTITFAISTVEQIVQTSTTLLLSVGMVVFVVIVVLFVGIVRSIAVPIRELTQASREIAKGDRSKRIAIVSHDEIGELAGAFNLMVDTLGQYHDTLEAKIQERTHALDQKVSELDAINKLMIGREVRMGELKKEIEQLKKGGDRL